MKTIRPFSWNVKTKDSNTTIYLTGKTLESDTVCVEICNFKSYVYMELPKDRKWTKIQILNIYDYFRQKIKVIDSYECISESQGWCKLHQKIPCQFLKIYFTQEWGAKKLAEECKSATVISGIGKVKSNYFKIHEQNIDTIIKFLTVQKIQPANWLKIKVKNNEELSDAQFNYKAHHSNVKLATDIPEGTVPGYNVMSFDLECYSKNHNSKLPDPQEPENVCFQIGATIFNTNDVNCENARRFILTMYNCPPIKNVTVENYSNELQLFNGFQKLIVRENIDIFIGYNTLKFDWDYIIKRCERIGATGIGALKFTSRIKDYPSFITDKKWSSSAYKTQKFKYLEIPGRLNIDVMISIMRNYKFDKYSLDFVSEKLLGERKDDVSAKQLFKLVQISQIFLKETSVKTKISDTRISEIKEQISTLIHKDEEFDWEGNPTVLHSYKQHILDSDKSKSIKLAIRQGIKIISEYCVQDTMLPIKLFQKTNIWPSMEQMANTVNVPISYLQPRGQQIKVLAQVYREAINSKIVIENKNYIDEIVKKYQGATVFKAVPGHYKNVVTLDYASLYPSIMISFNICHTTFIPKNSELHKNTPEEQYNVLKISEHVNCQHDPGVVSGKKKCKEGKTKVTKNDDGTEDSKDEWLCNEAEYMFFKPEYRLGLFPQLLQNVLGERKKVKWIMLEHEMYLKMNKGDATGEDYKYAKKVGWKEIKPSSLTPEQEKTFTIIVNSTNAQQLSLKVSANSAYGTFGARTGPMPLLEGASAVTAMGRMLIKKAVDFIEDKFPTSELVYGDSVTGDTPILCKANDNVFYKNIQDLIEDGYYIKNGEKEYCDLANINVWSDKGFTPIKTIIRHKTFKKIYRIVTRLGTVCVTEDHSLLDENGEEITPKQVKIGDLLLTKKLPSLQENDIQWYEYEFSPYIDHLTTFGFVKLDDSIKAANFYIYASFLNFSISIKDYETIILEDKDNISGTIIDIEEIRYSDGLYSDGLYSDGRYSDGRYVYDLETENHHFSAGIGQLVVHNTDSCMMHFKGATHSEAYNFGEVCEKMVNEILPKALKIEFENLYINFLLLTKKRYVAYKSNKDGKITGITEKGVVLARRDNTHYLKEVYKELVTMILDDKSEKEVMYKMYDLVNELFTRRIPARKLVIYKSVQAVDSYDEKNSLSHVMLAKKMIGRGEDVPPNTRLEYVFIKVPGENKNTLQGEKVEDYTYYRDNRTRIDLQLDPCYYLDKQLSKPITELLKVKYPKSKFKYINPELFIFGKVFKLPKKFQTVYTSLERENISKMDTMISDRIYTIANSSSKNKDDRLEKEIKALCEEYTEATQDRQNEIYTTIFGNIVLLSPRVYGKCFDMKELYERVRYLKNVVDGDSFPELSKQIYRLGHMLLYKKILSKYDGGTKRWNKLTTDEQKKTGLLTIDEDLMKNYTNSRCQYQKVINELEDLFSPFKFE